MKGSRESGAGRWTVIQVPTMSFYEYCELLNLDRPNIASDLKVTTLLHKSQIERTQIMMQLSKVQNHFMRYLQVGGFPELALADNDLMAQQIMREDVVDKVLKRDLPSLYNIRNATELERIFLYLCNVSSEIVSIEAITKELNGVSRTTVENYIQYLESANLIYQSWPVDMAGKKVLKARPKIYIADAAIRNAVLMDDSVLTDPVEMGKIVETAVYKHVAAFYYQYATSVGYFRGGKKGKEISVSRDRLMDTERINNRWSLEETDAMIAPLKGTWTTDTYMGYVLPYNLRKFEPDTYADEEARETFFGEYHEAVRAAEESPVPDISVEVQPVEEYEDGYTIRVNGYDSPFLKRQILRTSSLFNPIRHHHRNHPNPVSSVRAILRCFLYCCMQIPFLLPA